MLTRRTFQIAALSFSAAAMARTASSQENATVTVRIRADESVRALLPPIAQSNLTIEPDRSDAAQTLAQRAPPSKALPIILIIVGAIAVVELLTMIRELLRQVYYGGVLIDIRSQPPTITNDPSIPADMVFVVGTDGTTTKYTSDQFSMDVLTSALKVK